jgi:magnesium chelatase family protein
MVLGASTCPCVRPIGDLACDVCSRQDRARYLRRISALWQRTDIRLRLDPPDRQDRTAGESSAVLADRVAYARQIAADRWAALGYRVNAEVPGDVLRSGACRLPASDIAALLRLVQVGTVSEDGYERVLRVAWSISDLRAAGRPDRDDITNAIDLHVDHQP